RVIEYGLVAGHLRVRDEREPEVHRVLAFAEEFRRRDTDDCERSIVDFEGATDDGRIVVVLAVPIGVVHYRDWRRAGPVIIRREHSTGNRIHAENREVVS